jgi:hypothetical protein
MTVMIDAEADAKAKALSELIWYRVVIPTASKVYIYLAEHLGEQIPERELKAIAFPSTKSFERQSKQHEHWPPWDCINEAHRRIMEAKSSDAIKEWIDYLFELSIQLLRRNLGTFRTWLHLRVLPELIKKAMDQHDMEECDEWFKVRDRLPKRQQKIIKSRVSRKGEAHQKVNETKELALIEMEILRVTWQDVYGRWKREKENGPSAAEIIADRHHGLTDDQLAKHRRKHGRPKLRRD